MYGTLGCSCVNKCGVLAVGARTAVMLSVPQLHKVQEQYNFD